MGAFSRFLRVLKLAFGASAAAVFVRYCFFLLNYKRKQGRRKAPLPPGPTPLPRLLAGNVGPIIATSPSGPDGQPLFHKGLIQVAKKYAGIVGLWFGGYYTVIVTQPSVAQELFVKHGKFSSDRCHMQSHGGIHTPAFSIFTKGGKGITSSTGKYWRKVRTRLEVNISRKHIAEKNEAIVMSEVESAICAFTRAMALHPTGAVTELTSQLKRESMNVATKLLFSMRFGDAADATFQELQHHVEYGFKYLLDHIMMDMFVPALNWIPGGGAHRGFKREIEKRDAMYARLIASQRAKFEARKAQGLVKGEKDARNLAELFFMDQAAGLMDADGVHVVLWDILFAMTDTTATTNEWMIYYLINYPEVQAKLHEELDRVVGPDRMPTLADRAKMPYFWAVLKEVMRVRIVSPIMISHFASEDCVVHDTDGKAFTVPRGAQLFLHGYSMAQDPKLWDHPERFEPERWLKTRNAGLDLHGKESRRNTEAYKFTPFSLGPRMCPGYSFAKVSVFLQAATIFHCFRWELTPAGRIATAATGGKLDMTENNGMTIMPDRFSAKGYITAAPRPAARLAKFQPGDPRMPEF